MARTSILKDAEGTVVVGDDIVPFKQMERTELYNEWMRPNGYRHMMGANIRDRGSANLGALRRSDAVPFGPVQARLCRLLVPHLQRALDIHERAHLLETERGGVRLALDHLPIGFIVTDASARVVRANPAAEAIVGQEDGMRIERRRLCGEHPLENDLLQRLIADAAGEGSGGSLSLTRPSARPALDVLVSPLPPGMAETGGARARAAIFVSETDSVRSDARLAPARRLPGEKSRLGSAASGLVRLPQLG